MKKIIFFILFSVLIILLLLSSCDSLSEDTNIATSEDNSATSAETEPSATQSHSTASAETETSNQNSTPPSSAPETGVGGLLYYKNGDASYDLSDVSLNDSSSVLGIRAIGEVRIIGDVTEAQFNGMKGYFADNDSVSIAFNRTLFTNITGSDGYEYSIYSDQTESMMGYTIGEVQECGVIILKSYDNGSVWVYDNTSVVNVGNDTISYYPSGEDIMRGTIIRIVAGTKLSTQKIVGQKKEWHGPFSYEWVDEYDTFYITLIQNSTFFLGTNIIITSATN